MQDKVYIVGKRELANEKNVIPLLDLLKEKQIAENKWKIDYIYTYKGYVGFESSQKDSHFFK